MGLLPGKDSQSVATVFDFTILEMWDESSQNWVIWAQYGQTIRGFPNIIGRNGEPNVKGIESLIKATGWSGNVEELVEGTGWKPKPCQITVENQTYEGKTALKVAWINDWNSEGGGGPKTADAGSVKALALKYGAKMRAIAGNLARNMPPTAPKPSAPPPGTQEPPSISPEYVFDPADPQLQDFP
jgi:hypothetical protein